MVAISRDAIPIVKELRAVKRAYYAEAGVNTTLELRTIITGLLALLIWGGGIWLVAHRIPVPTWYGAGAASVTAFYFLDPKVLIATTIAQLRKETPTRPQEGDE